MNILSLKETERMAVISLPIYIFFRLVSPYLFGLYLMHIQSSMFLHQNLFFITSILGNIGFGYWLFVLAKQSNARHIVWLLIGLAYSDNIRHLIPKSSDTPLRFYPAPDSDNIRHLVTILSDTFWS